MTDPINVGRGIGLRLETSTEGLDMGRYPRARLWPVGGQVLSACQRVSVSVCQSDSLSVCQSVSLSVCQSVSPPASDVEL